MARGFVFPGQGSQAVGMLADFGDDAVVSRTLEEAGDILALPLSRIVRAGPEAELNLTEITQPALLCASVALWRVWRAREGAVPVAMAGHSLGEYSALVCAEAIDFEVALRLVRLRGKLMQRAVRPGQGAMAAILGLDDGDVASCCHGVAGVVSPANYNAPGQVVIAGEASAVDAAIANCQKAGAKRAIRLTVSVPSHCALMRPVAAEFGAALAAAPIRMPRVAVVQNVDAQESHTVDAIRERLVRQLSEPVRWTGCVERMRGLGAACFIECGPGRVLTGLIKRIDRSVSATSIDSAEGLVAALGNAAT